MKNESVVIDKRQVFLLFFSSIVIMILVFGAGVFFGKKLSSVAASSDKPEKVIKSPESEVKPAAIVTDVGVIDVTEQVVRLEEKSAEKDKGEIISFVKVEDKKVEAQKAADEKKLTVETREQKEKKEDRKIDKSKVALSKGDSQVEPKKQEIADAKFTLQVGAFPDRNQALKMAAELEKKGYESWIQRAKSKDKDIFRVRIGKFATKADAEKFKQQFDKKEKYNSFITPLE